MAADNTAVLQTDSLSLADPQSGVSGGILDLADNDLIADGGDVSAIAGWLTNGSVDQWADGGRAVSPAPAAIKLGGTCGPGGD